MFSIAFLNNNRFYRNNRIIWSLIIILFFSFESIAQSDPDKGISLQLRSTLNLNGTWQFQPALAEVPTDDWGTIPIPGAWTTHGNWWSRISTEITKGHTSIWQTDLVNLSRGWYRQMIWIPATWKGSAVVLELERVSTDAVIFVNGQKAGVIEWYAGVADLTPYIRFGTMNEIRILVIATPEEGKVVNLMGTAEDQVSYSKAVLATRGITGNVSIHRRPASFHVSDVFVKTSVRKKSIAAEIELNNAPPNKPLQITAAIYNPDGFLVKQFEKTIIPKNTKSEIIQMEDAWIAPSLWDLDEPNLYHLKLTVRAKRIVLDEYVQTFGFREFWIDGKNFYLNGTRINLRPITEPPGDGMFELIDAGIEGFRKSGFNFAELWPTNFGQRGEMRDWREIMDVADQKGFLLSGVALPFHFYIVDQTFAFTWIKPGVREKWEKRMVYELRKQRNHPSVVLWGTAANFFGNSQDQNPVNIGQTNWIKGNEFWQRNAKAAQEAIQIIKSYDPTRPVFTHHGTYVGDIHTLNFYLSLTPLQEREEWLSHYSQFGKIPFMAVEFGTPLHCTFLRGRNGFGNNVKTEPLVSEFVASYLGEIAYTTETDEYRNLIRKNFLGGQSYKPWTNPVEMERLPSFQSLQYLFVRNTWRSFRTWGIPGGMVPWHRGHGWTPDTLVKDKVEMPVFNSNRRGKYFPEVNKRELHFLQPGGWITHPAGQALIENNNDLLAYIAGSDENFTAKDHHFKEEDWVTKHLFFFNDTRKPQEFIWEIKVLSDREELVHRVGKLDVPVGEKSGIPLIFKLPSQKEFKRDGKIVLTTLVGNKEMRDTFLFRSFKSPEVIKQKEVWLFDPEGNTKTMLQRSGYVVNEWNGEGVPFVIIGRNALLPAYRMPADLESFVANGGKILLMNQHPEKVSKRKGFRTSEFVSRYVFPIDTAHPLMEKLDEKDFRNWTGKSKLIEAYPDLMNQPFRKGAGEIPFYGWHWGNQGGVATGAVEKPHHTAWRPILHCEFDLAFSPLMELPFGKGHLIWCNLDLEDHYTEDVIANLFLQRLIQYTDTVKPVARNQKTFLIGNDRDQIILNRMGLIYQTGKEIEKNTDLLIVGEVNSNQVKAIQSYTLQGGKVLVLPRRTEGRFLEVEFEKVKLNKNTYTVPRWNETMGISGSDIRFRTEHSPIVISTGASEISEDRLLAKKTSGKGSMIFIQYNPDALEADSLTFFRYTRWRHTRILAQVLANMGAAFMNDKAIFQQAKITSAIPLDGKWKAQMTNPVPAAKDVPDKHKDPGISPAANELIQPGADESNMSDVVSGMDFEVQKSEWAQFDGEIVYRKQFDVPAELTGKELELHLSIIDDYDNVFINGILVGKTGIEKEPVWNLVRKYLVPAGLLKEGSNVIAIRIWDTFGGGGLMSSPKKRELRQAKDNTIGLYHNDYIDDFEMGDDPFRYFRW